MTTDARNLVDGKYSISDLVDMDQLRDVFEKFTLATGFTIGFLDHPDLNVLIATGWRDICTKFHRGCPAAAEVCTKSNAHLLDQLSTPHQLEIELCDHGLVDCATPIIIKGKHIASLATGQLLLEEANIGRFCKQAQRFGFDEKKYLEALEGVPVVSEEQLRSVTAFLGTLALVITELGYATLKSKEEAERLAAEVAERKRVEVELRSSERKFRLLHESMRDAFVSVDMEGHFLDFNGVYQHMLGYTEEELNGKTYTDLTPEKWHGVEMNLVKEQVLSRGYSDVYEKEYYRKDGTVFPVELRTMLMRDSAGAPSAMWSIVRDVTERKQAEEERLKMESKIRHVQKLESLGVLAGGIAHDFNNLLMTILGNIELAMEEASSAASKRNNLLEAEKAGRRAAGLCREMLAYAGKGRFIIRHINIQELVEEMIHILKVSISKKAQLRSDFAMNLPAIEADAEQIRQVIMNLIINASDALGDGEGVVKITTGVMECQRDYFADKGSDEPLSEGTYVYLEVCDTGCGMDETTKACMFDPFFTTKFTGRGLGMSAVMGIVRGHKGAIKVTSKPGKGTTIRLLFPASSQPAESLCEAVDKGSWRGSGAILLVDDEEGVRAVGKLMLERMGFHVVLAEDGAAAIDLLRNMPPEGYEKFACVILDLTMPHMNGEETFQDIQRLHIDVPVLVSSGYDEQQVIQKFAGTGLAGFIQKPYRMKELATKLRKVLES